MQPRRQAPEAPNKPRRDTEGEMEMWKAQGRSGEERGEKRKGQEKNRKYRESERREGSLRVKK